MSELKRGFGALSALAAVACGNTETRTSCFQAETTVVELELDGGARVGARDLDLGMAPDAGVMPDCKAACDDWNWSNTCKVGTVSACAVDSRDGGAGGPTTVRCRVEYAPYCRTDPGPPC